MRLVGLYDADSGIDNAAAVVLLLLTATLPLPLALWRTWKQHDTGQLLLHHDESAGAMTQS